MEAQAGIFQCPKCGQKEMDNYRCWMRKKQYKGEELVWKYMFYNSASSFKKWVCCSVCENCEKSKKKNKEDDSSCSNPPKRLSNSYIPIPANPPIDTGGGSDCLCTCIGSIIVLPFYLLIFLWIDIYNYNKNKKVKYINVIGFDPKAKVVKKFEEKICQDIWKILEGLTEEEWDRKMKKECSNCKYRGKSIKDFMNINSNNKMNLDNTTNTTTIITTPKEPDLNDLIVFNITSGFSYPICLKKTQKFIEAEKKFVEDNQEFKGKNLIFLLGGLPIDKNKTIEQIGIKNGDNIVCDKNDLVN